MKYPGLSPEEPSDVLHQHNLANIQCPRHQPESSLSVRLGEREQLRLYFALEVRSGVPGADLQEEPQSNCLLIVLTETSDAEFFLFQHRGLAGVEADTETQ